VRPLLIFVSSLMLTACSSLGTVVVRSNPPEANVFLFDSTTGQNSVLGKTPLTFSKNVGKATKSEVLQIRIEKDGFEAKQASIAAFGRQTTYVDIKLSSVLGANAELHRAFEVNRQLMLEANRLAASKRYADALTRVDKVLETDPKNDEAHAARGSILYLMKDFDSAQSAWRKALEINPGNDLVRASIVDLNLGLKDKNRSPASTGGR
jgi:lipoprotein NlpI